MITVEKLSYGFPQKDLYNEIENMVIQETLDQLADEVGIENFELPECEDLAIVFEYNEKEDISKLISKQ